MLILADLLDIGNELRYRKITPKQCFVSDYHAIDIVADHGGRYQTGKLLLVCTRIAR